ncbi:VOC family protein [Microbulbifer sp. SAOS-129_SWC]|uniref:VOC family protein n=1 Tax=Microbulbifer sp. SAOS-129_SWC TaxID=3145235 RepID=UPI00321694A3
MLDHIGLHVHSYERSKAFYRQALAPLGYELILEFADWAGFGWAGKADFWITGGKSTAPGIHVAFRADDRDIVDAFYKAALEAGGKDNGAPGERPEYHEHYYGAYVIDPDGHNIEVVCHTPQDLYE